MNHYVNFKKYSHGHLRSNNITFLSFKQITFKDIICVCGKYKIKFSITTFVAHKNEFCNKFAGVATAKDFVSKFNVSQTDASLSTHSAHPATVDVRANAEMSEEDVSLVCTNRLNTPKKKKKKKKACNSATWGNRAAIPRQSFLESKPDWGRNWGTLYLQVLILHSNRCIRVHFIYAKLTKCKEYTVYGNWALKFFL